MTDTPDKTDPAEIYRGKLKACYDENMNTLRKCISNIIALGPILDKTGEEVMGEMHTMVDTISIEILTEAIAVQRGQLADENFRRELLREQVERWSRQDNGEAEAEDGGGD